MTAMVVDLLVNVAMAGLLAVTISYCWMLNRRIKVLQDSKSELSQLLKHFDESTQRASESIVALQSASKKIGENIQARIDKANYLLDDLAFMLEKGSKLSEQLEANIALKRAKDRVKNEEHVSEEIMPVPHVQMDPEEPLVSSASKEKARASLEAMLHRLAGRNKPGQPSASKEEAAIGAKSRSEQELVALLRSGLKG